MPPHSLVSSPLGSNRPHTILAVLIASAVGLTAFLSLSPEAEAQRRRRERGPERESMYLRLAFAVPGACVEGSDFCGDDASSTFAAIAPDIAFGGRFGLLGVEGRGFLNPFEIDGQEASFGGLVGSLKLFPVSKGQFDPYLAAGVGVLGASKGDRESDQLSSLATHLGGGVDMFLNRNFALGVGFDRYFLLASESDGDDISDEGFWTARLNLTIYFGPASSGQKARPKKVRKPKTEPRKPKRVPRKKKELF